MKKLKLLRDGKTTFLYLDEIIKIEASINYSFIYLRTGEKLTSAKTLKKYEDILSPYFIRCNRNQLINKSYIKILRKEITLTTGEKVSFSRRKFEEYKAKSSS